MECLWTPYVVPWHPWRGRTLGIFGICALGILGIHWRGRTLGIRADACARPRGWQCFTLGNFKTDATVRPSHERPYGHCPTVRPSVIVRVTTLLAGQ
jgi:hypothetical protein